METSNELDSNNPNPSKANMNNADRHNPNWERETLEKIALAHIEQQKQAVELARLQRRNKNIWRSIWLVLALLLLWLMVGGSWSNKTSAVPHTALVELKGEIASEGPASADSVMTGLRAAFEDDNTKAVLLLINSPGGSPVQAGIINDEIVRLKALHKKPIYAVVEESCASAAYYIAVATDKIFVDKASIVGSIGVLMDGFGFTGLMDKVGVERRLMTAGENKGFLDPFSPQTKAHKAYAQAMLDQIHQQFITAVKNGRGQRLKESPEIFSGLFWSGQQAVEMGLADGLGSMDFVARDVVKVPDIVDFTQHENVAERLAKRFGVAVGQGAVASMGNRFHLH